VVARGALRAILARYLATSPSELRFDYGRHGKPALDAARNAGDLRFNLAHSGGVALYGVTRGRDLGVDVEWHRSRDEDGLAERFFSRRETAALRALPPASRPAAFYACWSRKEAYIKATGLGLTAALDRFSVALGPDEVPALLHVEDDPQEAGRWALVNLDVDEGYAAALCVEGPAGAVSCWRWP
jgi:4'-phosphopantetheinyl transferase